MWEWREDTARGHWRLSETGSWLWDEPSALERWSRDAADPFASARPAGAAGASRPDRFGDPLAGSAPARGRPGAPTAGPGAPPAAVPGPRAGSGRSWRWVPDGPHPDPSDGPDPLDPLDPHAVGWSGPRPGDEEPWSGAPIGGAVSAARLWADRPDPREDLGIAWIPRPDADREPTPIFEAVADDADGRGGAHAASEGRDAAADEMRRRAERRRRPLVAAAGGSRHALREAGGGDEPVGAVPPAGRHLWRA